MVEIKHQNLSILLKLHLISSKDTLAQKTNSLGSHKTHFIYRGNPQNSKGGIFPMCQIGCNFSDLTISSRDYHIFRALSVDTHPGYSLSHIF